MATLSAKSSFIPGYRHHAVAASNNFHPDLTSPTDSEFSLVDEESNDHVRDWDMRGVAEWLKSINAGQYIELFRAHDITGENVMDLDQAMLKEMGIKKIGDRVRIGAQAKHFRYSEYMKKRESARVSLAAEEHRSAYSDRREKGIDSGTGQSGPHALLFQLAPSTRTCPVKRRTVCQWRCPDFFTRRLQTGFSTCRHRRSTSSQEHARCSLQSAGYPAAFVEGWAERNVSNKIGQPEPAIWRIRKAAERSIRQFPFAS